MYTSQCSGSFGLDSAVRVGSNSNVLSVVLKGPPRVYNWFKTRQPFISECHGSVVRLSLHL